MPRAKQRTLGRPPMTESADTRARIIQAAQKCFALHGYDRTTNRIIADEADLTTGALYHYFDSKQSLFVAVLVEEDVRVLNGFREAAATASTAVGMLQAIFDRAVDLHRDDEYLAKFVSIAPIEIDRHPEFRTMLADARGDEIHSVQRFFGEIVDAAQESGEFHAGIDRSAIVDMLSAVSQGLAQLAGLVPDPVAHADAIDAFKRLLEGSLVRADLSSRGDGGLGRRRRRLPVVAR